jgi:demethylmenaquinone methyltransferase/2-methoxy-6-polyprenyl-1,4-benzoquinol methylase
MFASIAARYDLLNHLLSGNIDRRWRRLVAKNLRVALADSKAQILDVACGTGDLALTLKESGSARIIGIDFCRPMLEIAATKANKNNVSLPFVEGDALSLPFSDRSFEAATIAFGLRNFANVEAGIKELMRILKPGGQVVVLEFSKPVVPVVSSLFQFYFAKVLPRFGGWLSGCRSAYQYLPDSVTRFPDQHELAALMTAAGFENVKFSNLTGGVAAVHVGTRPR